MTIEVYHGQLGGAESFGATTTLTVIIPPATLDVFVHTTTGAGGKNSPDFTLTATGTNVSPATFPGSETGTTVSLSPGSYSVTEAHLPSYATSGTCSGSIISGASSTCIFTNIFTTNQPPVLTLTASSSVAINELVPFSFSASATDPESDPLTFSAPTLPAGATFNPSTKVFSWTPSEAQGPGDYTAVIAVTDGINTVTQTVAIHVNEVNQAPVASGATVSTHQNTALPITLVASDSDIPIQPLTYIIVSTSTHGTLGAVSLNSITYTPDTNYRGPDSFTFKANDGAVDSNTATVNINVSDDAPVFSAPTPDQTIPEMQLFSLMIVATDPNSDPLTYSLTTAPLGAAIDPLTGVFSWTPTEAQGPGGPYPVTVAVSDGALTNSESFNVNVTEVNVLPVANDASTTTAEDTPVAITLSASDSDIPAQLLTFAIASSTSHGILGVISGDQVTYTPDANYNGADSFTFTANDGVGDSNAATVDITVTPVNDPPTITLLGLNPMNLLVGDAFVDPGATSTDIEDAPSTPPIVVTGGPVSTATSSVFTLVYTATDSGGLTASTTRTVNVTAVPDTTPPVITLNGSSTVNLLVGDSYTDAGATASDNVDGDITANIVVVDPVNTEHGGNLHHHV